MEAAFIKSIETSERSKYIALSLLFSAWFLGYIDRVAINVAVLPIGKEFNFNSQQIGIIMGSFFASYSVMQILGGWLADRYGSDRILIVCILLWSLFTLLTGVAWSFLSLVLFRFIFGIGEGAFPSASSVWIAEMFSNDKRARAKSWLLSTSGLGSAFGTLVVASLLGVLGWRNIFLLLGILGVIIAIVSMYFLRTVSCVEKQIKEPQKVSLKQLINISLIWKLIIIWFGAGIVTWGLLSWMPSYWINVKKLSMVSMGIAMTIPALGLFLSINIGGWILDKYLVGREKHLLIAGTSITAVCLYLMFNASSIALGVIYMTLAMMANGITGATVFALPLKYLPKKIIGSSTGLINFGGQLAGMVAPIAMGFMINKWDGSYSAAFGFLITWVCISFLIGITLETYEESSNKEKGEI